MGRFFQIFGGSIFGLFLLFTAVLLNQWFGPGPGGGNDDNGAADYLEEQGAEIQRGDDGEVEAISLPENIGDEDIRAVAELRSLVDVRFENPWNITNWGVSQLASLRGLQVLYLNGADISDGCIENLIELQELQELAIEETGISFAGYEYLKDELPDCNVYWSPREDGGEAKADIGLYPDK